MSFDSRKKETRVPVRFSRVYVYARRCANSFTRPTAFFYTPSYI